jgi:uncharacterized coiled-coil protein SlyX
MVDTKKDSEVIAAKEENAVDSAVVDIEKEVQVIALETKVEEKVTEPETLEEANMRIAELTAHIARQDVKIQELEGKLGEAM